ncbi:hypothetical protein Cob_v004629 [Colletotrichum orbiculare MAFF 240422]|uniref:Uncharacterized protein n=1 Tax=Colletotrichum orbiculare (strain 104-T / ATCC 96160 / CBS 514.97 / LARS 414 / MAFF 240422) TaxID=1213857 RepID=A0A484FXE4_COLOR|nr:hypothetical protein Cob_v004629 [Colletotrichum orbiculare MAFF 240422]
MKWRAGVLRRKGNLTSTPLFPRSTPSYHGPAVVCIAIPSHPAYFLLHVSVGTRRATFHKPFPLPAAKPEASRAG